MVCLGIGGDEGAGIQAAEWVMIEESAMHVEELAAICPAGAIKSLAGFGMKGRVFRNGLPVLVLVDHLVDHLHRARVVAEQLGKQMQRAEFVQDHIGIHVDDDLVFGREMPHREIDCRLLVKQRILDLHAPQVGLRW